MNKISPYNNCFINTLDLFIYNCLKDMYKKKSTKTLSLFPFFFILFFIPINLFCENSDLQTQYKESIYESVEITAKFPGGILKAFETIKQNIQYPDSSFKNNIEGRVIVKFDITENGKSENFSILSGINNELNNEAIRLMKKLPDWIPASVDGRNVSSTYFFPISFFLDKSEKSNVQNRDTISQMIPIKSVPIIIDNLILPPKFDVAALNMDYISSGIFEKPYPKTKQTELVEKYGLKAMHGVMFLKTIRPEIISKNRLDSLKSALNLIDVSDEIPVFKGEKTAFSKFIADNVKYKVYAQELELNESNVLHLIIDSLGNLIHIGFEEEGLKLFQLEIVRVMKSVINWIPYTLNNTKYNSLINIPYSFNIEKGEKGKFGAIHLFNDNIIIGKHQPEIILDNNLLSESFDLSLLELNNLVEKKSQKNNSKFYFETKTNSIMISTITYLDSTQIVDGDVVFHVIEQMPTFPGGDEALFQYLSQNIVYPEISRKKQEQGRVILTFVINQLGKVMYVDAIKGEYPMLIDEAIRLIKKMPDWNPGKQRGKPVPVKYTIPINFNLN